MKILITAITAGVLLSLLAGCSNADLGRLHTPMDQDKLRVGYKAEEELKQAQQELKQAQQTAKKEFFEGKKAVKKQFPKWQ